MHSAKIEHSDRLKRVLDVLNNNTELSTRDIIILANVCAVNSCISELRANGYNISCRRDGEKWMYSLIQ
jgi:hypothetical protein